MVDYRQGNDLDLDDVIALYRACSLGARRPLNERERMTAMMRHANLVITAWDAKTLVGIARAFSDFSYVTYLSDLAIRDSHQKLGIGKELLRRTRQAGGAQTDLVLLAAPTAVEYYPKLGFTRHLSAWVLKANEPLL